MPGSLRAGRDGNRFAQVPRQLGTLRRHVSPAVAVRIGDPIKHPTEGRQAVAVIGREVGAAEEGLQLRREEDAHRPSPTPGHGLDGRHVDVIQVRALLAIDLDRHEVAIQLRSGLLVLERLALHDVAPVAGRIADRQEDRPIQLTRLAQRLRPPRIPVDGVVGVLQQVRARLVRQAVGHDEECGTGAAEERRGRPGALRFGSLRSSPWLMAPAEGPVTLRLLGCSLPMHGGIGSCPAGTATGTSVPAGQDHRSTQVGQMLAAPVAPGDCTNSSTHPAIERARGVHTGGRRSTNSARASRSRSEPPGTVRDPARSSGRRAQADRHDRPREPAAPPQAPLETLHVGQLRQ